MTQIFTTIASLRNYLKSKQNLGQTSVGLVPTMGALHIGHLSLIDRARVENTCVVVSIFVNPLQFGKGEDFEKYPRTLKSDRQICDAANVDAIFAPSAEEIGVNDPTVTQVIPPPEMMNIMCGRSRVGHFQGVATIVTKLLNIVQPDRAYFGEKDGQQLAIIRRLVNDLNLPVEIIGCPTLRELSGLAYSSRNQYLSESDRLLAPHLYQSLLKGKQVFSQDCSKISAAAILTASRDYLSKLPAIALEYIQLVDVKTMQPCHTITSSSELMLAIAARIGNTRLIDNILLTQTLSQTIPDRKPIIAIDGPAGAGKSTVTKLVANKLGLLFLDTGAMYRSVTLAVLREGIDLNDHQKVEAIATKSQIQLFANAIAGQPMQVLLNGEDITTAIRQPEVTANVSAIAAQSAVREILVKQQQIIGQSGGVVMEGRDIGTHVFPDAEVKIFLTASASERAKRRHADLIAQGQVAPDLATLEKEISERDRQDSTRTHAPLIQAEDATLVNTDSLTIEEVVDVICMQVEVKSKKMKKISPITNHQSPITKLSLIFISLLAIAASSLPATQAQNANTALTIRADVQEANSITGVVTATGNVKMTYPARQIDAIAEQAQYFSKEQRVVLTGNVVVTQEGVNSIKAQTITYLVSEGKFLAAPQNNQQVETIYIVPDRELATTPATSASPIEQIKPAFKKQRVSPPTTPSIP